MLVDNLLKCSFADSSLNISVRQVYYEPMKRLPSLGEGTDQAQVHRQVVYYGVGLEVRARWFIQAPFSEASVAVIINTPRR